MVAATGGLEAAGSSPLGSIANKVSPRASTAGDSSTDIRLLRLELRALSQVTLPRERNVDGAWVDDRGTQRLRACGQAPYGQRVDFVDRGGHCIHEGLVACGSVWSCPVCAGIICAERARELTSMLAAARARGWWAYLVTLTVPHTLEHQLKPLRKLIADAWGSVVAGKAWAKQARRSLGFEGYVRAVEITRGYQHGWHPHLHVIILTRYQLPEELTERERKALDYGAVALLDLVREHRKHDAEERRGGKDWRIPAEIMSGREGALLRRRRKRKRSRGAARRRSQPTGRGSPPPESVEGLWLWMWRRWARAVKRLGLDKAPSLLRGVSIDGANNAARYLAKMGLVNELVGTGAKKGRSRNLTHWQLLALCRNSASARDLWREFAEGMKGAKQLTYSKGLRAEFGLGEDLDDEEALVAAEGAEVHGVLSVSSALWLQRKLAGKTARALERAVEQRDLGAAAVILGGPHDWSFFEPSDLEWWRGQEVRTERANDGNDDGQLVDGVDFDHLTGELYDEATVRRRRNWFTRTGRGDKTAKRQAHRRDREVDEQSDALAAGRKERVDRILAPLDSA